MTNTLDQYLSSKKNNLDFIRFVAAVMVIFSHSFDLNTVVSEPLEVISNYRFSFGSMAVAIFFIISGILITQSFQRSSSLYTFTASRVLRIFPALITVTILTIFLLGTIVTSHDLRSYFSDVRTFTYLQNISGLKLQYELPGVFEHNPYPKTVNGSLWSLRYEIICYCLVVIIGFILRKKYVLPLIGLLIMVLIFEEKLFDVTMIYFFIGALTYIFRKYISLSVGFALLSTIIFLTNIYFNINRPITFIINGLSLGYLIIYLGFFNTKYLQNFTKNGDYSYGIYIYAFPIQQLLYFRFNHLTPIYCFLISTVITIPLAMLSWHLVEKRALALKQRLTGS